MSRTKRSQPIAFARSTKATATTTQFRLTFKDELAVLHISQGGKDCKTEFCIELDKYSIPMLRALTGEYEDALHKRGLASDDWDVIREFQLVEADKTTLAKSRALFKERMSSRKIRVSRRT